ncbi:Rad3-related DNA helicase [Hahella chejuensis KCTC 2396]|uniref:Rad3-related DNA helicase n=1 Tax=Hahella chejuensis (strain KCTC 2396) TaxID=349521 RepID=Q2SNK0_HAHCH|nr:ATP-dependent DNA helicase [Hahella chejuensis]ABC27774.1 Rad3-related DNA helicase [Hahella chejuensis KCTC 2396]
MAIKTSASDKLTYKLSVREAAHFLAQLGDLDHQDRETASAREGQLAHKQVQESWPADYVSEAPVKITLSEADFQLQLQGRIDGLRVADDHVLFEEIKTLRQDPQRLPLGLAERHRLQLLLYALLWRQEQTAPPPTPSRLRLNYVRVPDMEQTRFDNEMSCEEAQQESDALFQRLQDWYRSLTQHRFERNALLRDLDFPYSGFRPGQRELARQTYLSLRDAGQALIEAPTGSGKSLATLFPALKAMGEGHLDQVMLITAKTSSQEAALKALRDMRLHTTSLRVLHLHARERICGGDSVCDPLDCPRRRDFYQRLPEAREEALAAAWLDGERLRDIALKHDLCPHGLQGELAPWVDVLIGDYNYAFSPQVRSDSLFTRNRVGLLADEAHNLPDRARDLFSAELSEAPFNRIGRQCKALKKDANAVAKAINQMQITPEQAPGKGQQALEGRLQDFCAAAENWLMSPQDLLAPADTELNRQVQEAIFNAQAWIRLAPSIGDDFACFERHWEQQRVLSLRCLSPARLLRPMLQACHGATLFSATLTPPYYYQNLLGLEENPRRLRSLSPFPPEHLGIFVAPYLNFRLRSRESQLDAVCALIHQTIASRPGNYWTFTPAFSYMEQLTERFAALYPEVEFVQQTRQASQEDQQRFLARFRKARNLLGFTVIGGVYGESIDMVGDSLVGCIILGPGLPQISPVNEQVSAYFERQGMDGFAYAYQLPGWQKVVQAAGRVIRTELDKGVVILVDDRFTKPPYPALEPQHWRPRVVRTPKSLQTALLQFWSQDSTPDDNSDVK